MSSSYTTLRPIEGHCLNPAAARVWRRCDGRTPADGLSAQLALDADTVEQALAELEACELLEAPLEPTLDVVHNGGSTRREVATKAVKVGVGVAAGAMVLSQTAPAAAQTTTQVALCCRNRHQQLWRLRRRTTAAAARRARTTPPERRRAPPALICVAPSSRRRWRQCRATAPRTAATASARNLSLGQDLNHKIVRARRSPRRARTSAPQSRRRRLGSPLPGRAWRRPHHCPRSSGRWTGSKHDDSHSLASGASLPAPVAPGARRPRRCAQQVRTVGCDEPRPAAGHPRVLVGDPLAAGKQRAAEHSQAPSCPARPRQRLEVKGPARSGVAVPDRPVELLGRRQPELVGPLGSAREQPQAGGEGRVASSAAASDAAERQTSSGQRSRPRLRSASALRSSGPCWAAWVARCMARPTRSRTATLRPASSIEARRGARAPQTSVGRRLATGEPPVQIDHQPFALQALAATLPGFGVEHPGHIVDSRTGHCSHSRGRRARFGPVEGPAEATSRSMSE